MKSSVCDRKYNWVFALIVFNLVGVYIYTFYVLLSYDLNWMEFEKIKTHIWILENGKQWHWEDFAKALNTKIIEIDPNRLSRPLSNLLEVIDAKFRANLWDHIPPHPSLSLQWPFLFIGLPLLLYKFLRNLECQPVIALAGTSLYLTSAGFLSPIVELSHPAKSMVNFFSILCLVLATQLYRWVKHKVVSIKDIPCFWLIMTSCLLCAVITFFSDETGLYLFVVLGFIFLPIFLKIKEKTTIAACYLVLPVIYFIIIHFLLPWLHYIVDKRTVDLGSYRDFPHLSSLFFPNWHDLVINFYLLFSVHPGLKWYFVPLLKHPFVLSLQCAYTVAFIFLTGSFIYAVYKTPQLSSRAKQVLSAALLLILFVFFHNFQLSHNVRVWTVFWYGCLFSLIYYVTLTLVLQLAWEGTKGNVFRYSFPLIIVIFTAHGLMTTTYLVQIFKDQRYNPGYFYYPSIFNGVIDIYQYFDMSQTLERSKCRYIYTLFYWSKVKHKDLDLRSFSRDAQLCAAQMGSDPYFRADMIYAVVESAFEFPEGRSFLNDPDYVAHWMHQTGEPP